METANLIFMSLTKTTNDRGHFLTANKRETIQDKTADCCRSRDRNCVFTELSIRDLNTVLFSERESWG